jgi:FKBP-type peptidyl-prolyl cis-trans isomerase 2
MVPVCPSRTFQKPPAFFKQLYKITGKTIWGDCMKKSEKLKGKAAVAKRKKQYTRYAVAATAVIVVLLIAGFYLFNPFVAKNGDTVAIYFTGTLDNGTIVQSNVNSTPFVFTIGKEDIRPYGLPDAVIGMQKNETRTVILPPEKAFGKYDPSLVQIVNRSTLPPDSSFVVGQGYQLVRKSDNAVAYVTILNVTPETVAWDGNLDLAGQNLTLKLTLVQIL